MMVSYAPVNTGCVAAQRNRWGSTTHGSSQPDRMFPKRMRFIAFLEGDARVFGSGRHAKDAIEGGSQIGVHNR